MFPQEVSLQQICMRKFAHLSSKRLQTPEQKGAPTAIYRTCVILSNHHPNQTARHSFSGFFQFRLANHRFRLANPTNIANANPDSPTSVRIGSRWSKDYGKDACCPRCCSTSSSRPY
ncbi:unnamed protein product [Ascophyllum nodosum]